MGALLANGNFVKGLGESLGSVGMASDTEGQLSLSLILDESNYFH